MAKYTEKQNAEGIAFIVRDNGDSSESWIPKNENNSDYQAYLNKDTLPSKLSIPSTPQAGA